MASRAQIAIIARRIEALRAAAAALRGRFPDETEEQALADYEKSAESESAGQSSYIITGVPRSPDWGKW